MHGREFVRSSFLLPKPQASVYTVHVHMEVCYHAMQWADVNRYPF